MPGTARVPRLPLAGVPSRSKMPTLAPPVPKSIPKRYGPSVIVPFPFPCLKLRGFALRGALRRWHRHVLRRQEVAAPGLGDHSFAPAIPSELRCTGRRCHHGWIHPVSATR